MDTGDHGGTTIGPGDSNRSREPTWDQNGFPSPQWVLGTNRNGTAAMGLRHVPLDHYGTAMDPGNCNWTYHNGGPGTKGHDRMTMGPGSTISPGDHNGTHNGSQGPKWDCNRSWGPQWILGT